MEGNGVQETEEYRQKRLECVKQLAAVTEAMIHTPLEELPQKIAEREQLFESVQTLDQAVGREYATLELQAVISQLQTAAQKVTQRLEGERDAILEQLRTLTKDRRRVAGQ